jgi:hypothetical protein
MPAIPVSCSFCSKSVRSDAYAAHCISKHADEIAAAMPADAKQRRIASRVPLIVIYNEARTMALMCMCLECKKYSRYGSERNGNIALFVKQHSKSECVKSFDKHKSLFETEGAPEPTAVDAPAAPAPVAAPAAPVSNTFLDNALAALEEEYEENDDYTKEEFVLQKITKCVRSGKKSAEVWAKRIDKIQKAKDAVQEEYQLFKQKQAFRLTHALRRAIKAADVSDAESFNEEINDYDSEEFAELHSVYQRFLEIQ